jgi:hypothetical protein
MRAWTRFVTNRTPGVYIKSNGSSTEPLVVGTVDAAARGLSSWESPHRPVRI